MLASSAADHYSAPMNETELSAFPLISLPIVPPIDRSLTAAIQRAIDSKTKPLGALGQLEQLAKKIALVQQSVTPVATGCQLLLFAADHGIAQAGVSAYPPEVTRQMVLNFLAGGSAANVFSQQNDVDMLVVDAGVAGEPILHDDLCSKRIAAGTRNFLDEPAMSTEQVATALNAGMELGAGTDSSSGSAFPFVAFGEMGIGNSSSAAMIAHKLSGYSLQEIVGRGTGLDDAGLEQKLTILQRASARTEKRLDPLSCLREYGGFEIAMMAGAMIGAASVGRCLLVDGFISTSAMLIAQALRPTLLDYAIFTHNSAESGHAVMLKGLGESAVLDLDLRLGEGTGALLAWPIIRCAVHMLNDMASFESSGVSNKE